MVRLVYQNFQMEAFVVSVFYLAPSIFSASILDRWAVTLSLKDGCFWAYLPTVSELGLLSKHLVKI